MGERQREKSGAEESRQLVGGVGMAVGGLMVELGWWRPADELLVGSGWSGSVGRKLTDGWRGVIFRLGVGKGMGFGWRSARI